MRSLRMPFARAYWLATGLALGAGVAGVAWALPAAIALTAIQCVHFRAMGHAWGSLPVQVRVVFLGLLFAGLWPPLAFIHVLQCIGTWTNVLVDYCPLARLLSLMPWYRHEPLTWESVGWTLFSPPAPGSILERRVRRMEETAAWR
jgi:hypothetical protein